MAKKSLEKKQQESQIPLILRFHRLMDAFTKSDDERDFYLDSIEGFIIYVDLDKEHEELEALEKELTHGDRRYFLIPKMTFFEIKKFMEGFIQEKVYDIDTKEKLLDIINAKEPRENFLEYIYDNLTELEKWQLYYQERSRIRIIEWLRSHDIQFVFEEDLDLSIHLIEKIKHTCFDTTASKDIIQGRKVLAMKAKTYYSNEALNPRPKRGRPPKQATKIAIEPQFTTDLYLTVPKAVRYFLYIPNITGAESVTFSSKFETEEALLASLRGSHVPIDKKLEALSQRLESLQDLSQQLEGTEEAFGVKKKKSILPTAFSRPKFKKPESISHKVEKEEKIESAIGGVLSKIDKEKKEKNEKKRFGIKKVAPISSVKKKKKK